MSALCHLRSPRHRALSSGRLLAGDRYLLPREQETPSTFDPGRLIDAHRGSYKSEADMETASVTRILASAEALALPPAWFSQPEFDDNVPPAIASAVVTAYRAARRSLEHVRVPGASHSLSAPPWSTTDRCVVMTRHSIRRRLAGG